MGLSCKPCGKNEGIFRKLDNKLNKEKAMEKKAEAKSGKAGKQE